MGYNLWPRERSKQKIKKHIKKREEDYYKDLIEDNGLTSPAYSHFQLMGKDIAKYYYYLLLNIIY